MTKKVSPTRPARNAERGRRYKTMQGLRAAVHAACWAELTEALGEGEWKGRVERLKIYLADPSEEERRARDLFGRLRNAMIDIVVATQSHAAASKRYHYDEGPPPDGGACLSYLEKLSKPFLIPILEHKEMKISREWLDGVRDRPNDKALRALAEKAKRHPPRWDLSKRSRLVNLLDRYNMLLLPPRENAYGASRFLNEREYTLLSLLLGIGVLDEENRFSKKLHGDGVSVADVIREEFKRIQPTVERHGRGQRDSGTAGNWRPHRGP